MWPQLRAIAWAQLCTARNHFPRTGIGGLLYAAIALLWYGLYAALGLALADVLPEATLPSLREWVPVGLLAMLVFWQFVPLVTFSGGWSLDISKLRIFPVRDSTLFWIEVVLRLTTAPEMIFVLLGGTAGLLRHPQVAALFPLVLLLYIPFNLFLSLAIRDALRRLFRKNRWRELLGILIVGLSVFPSFLLTSSLGRNTKRGFLRVATVRGTPWDTFATYSLGSGTKEILLAILGWCLVAYLLARWQFVRALALEEDTVEARNSPATASDLSQPRRASNTLLSTVAFSSAVLRDPIAALVQKELRSLRRIPRFRVIFGMACLFGALLFAQIMHNGAGTFGADNFLPLVNVYGFFLLGEVLLWNVFGFDRWATQFYYLAPVDLRAVLVAKNLVALFFMLLQSLVVLLVVALLRFDVTVWSIANEFAVSAVVAVFFLAAGNLTSVMLPRRVEPTQTFRKQASGVAQAWLLASSLGICLLLSFAFLARYAFGTNWAFLAVLGIEFCVGVLVYRIAMESAVERAGMRREHLLDALSGGSSPLSS